MAAILLTADIEEASDLVDVLLVGVSLAVAAVPEGLPAVLSVVLALGVQRMARQHAIVKKLSSVETLGSASVICSDKTGTLTRNEMTIEKVVTALGRGRGHRHRLPARGRAARRRPAARRPGRCSTRSAPCSPAAAWPTTPSLREEDGEWTIQGDPTEAAFLVAEAQGRGPRTRRARRASSGVGEVPFTSERKLMSTLEADAEREGRRRGRDQGRARRAARPLHRTSGSAGEVAPARPTSAGARSSPPSTGSPTRRCARWPSPTGRCPTASRPPADESLERELVFLGMVGIIDPPRAEARAAIAEAHAAGVRVVMITGDHPAPRPASPATSASSTPARRRLTGAELDAARRRRAARRRCGTSSVYARVAPEHKLRIVDALQADGNIVAMTGDGVNDAPALKSADIGVAMGITGTDVTKEAADMILADDNFATIVAAVARGPRRSSPTSASSCASCSRRTSARCSRCSSASCCAGVIGLDDDRRGGRRAAARHADPVDQPAHRHRAGAGDGRRPAARRRHARPPRRLTDRVIDAEMWVGIVCVGAGDGGRDARSRSTCGLAGGLVGGSGDVDEARTMAFTTLVLAQLFNCFNARSDRTSAFHHLFTNRCCGARSRSRSLLQVAVVQLPFLNDAFDTTPLGARRLAASASALASVVLWADEARKLVARRLEMMRTSPPAKDDPTPLGVSQPDVTDGQRDKC